MLFNFSLNYGIPASIVLDAAGFFGATAGMWGDGILDQADVAGFGAVPASDGTYTGNFLFGYLGLGPAPLATTEWNLTRAAACGTAVQACMGVGTSGVLPLVTDMAVNTSEYSQGDGIGVGGVPIWDGPYTGFSPNFDILSLTLTNPDAGYSIVPNCDFGIDCGPPPVPVPATVWLFGTGLLGLLGTARRKRMA